MGGHPTHQTKPGVCVQNPTPVDLARAHSIITAMNAMKLTQPPSQPSPAPSSDHNPNEIGDELIFPTQVGVIFVNLTNPAILQVRGQWRGIISDDDTFAEAVREVHQCNVTRSGPKAYLLPLSECGHYSIGAESNLIVQNGATDEQLTHFFEVALTMVMGFFHDLTSSLPTAVNWEVTE